MVGKNRGLLLNGEIHLFYVTKQLIAHSEVEAVAAVTPSACAWDRGIVVIVDGRALRARATDCCLVQAC